MCNQSSQSGSQYLIRHDIIISSKLQFNLWLVKNSIEKVRVIFTFFCRGTFYFLGGKLEWFSRLWGVKLIRLEFSIHPLIISLSKNSLKNTIIFASTSIPCKAKTLKEFYYFYIFHLIQNQKKKSRKKKIIKIIKCSSKRDYKRHRPV